MKFKCRLVFSDVIKDYNQSIYNSEEYLEFLLGDFHSGTVFDAEIEVSDDDLKNMLNKGFKPVFYVIK